MCKYSVLILAKDEEENLLVLLPTINRIMRSREESYELVVIDGASRDRSLAVAKEHGAQAYVQAIAGYGPALAEGLARCRGEWIIAIDADLSHPPDFIGVIIDLIRSGQGYDIIIGSRYIAGGSVDMPLFRKLLSRILNLVYSQMLLLPVKDMSSGLRGYRASVVKDIRLTANHYDVLIELLVKALQAKAVVKEIPINYAQRHKGMSHVKLASFAVAYLKSLFRLMRLRYSRGQEVAATNPE